MNKIAESLKAAICDCGLRDGMCISFHHHLRNGDYVMNMVMEQIASLGIKKLTVNASAILNNNGSLIEHIKNGTVTALETDYMEGQVGMAVSQGLMENPVVFRTHGGRPASLQAGKSHIDVAFIAASTSDEMGNCTGKQGKSACGSLGYAFADAMFADCVIIITDNLVSYPLTACSISEDYVDYVVKVDSIGNPSGIVSGTTMFPRDPVILKIAEYAARSIEGMGILKNGFSFQTGAGGASLAASVYLKEIMMRENIKASFVLGGITGYIVDMLREGCIEAIQDVQCFDLKSVESIRTNPGHQEISAAQYASPNAKSCVADSLDVVVLGAAQIDHEFNVNVHTNSLGEIIGGSGGHTDVAECAGISMIAAPLSRARIPLIVDRVNCISTPGSSIDLLVTQYGIAVNPIRQDILSSLKQSGLPIKSMEELNRIAEKINGVPNKPRHNSRKIVGEILNRDDTLLDTIYQI